MKIGVWDFGFYIAEQPICASSLLVTQWRMRIPQMKEKKSPRFRRPNFELIFDI